MRALLVLLVTAAAASFAQGKATLIDAPLDVKLARSPADVQRLQSDFRQLLAKNPNLLLPTRSNWKAALAKAGPLECEGRNECLRQLAVAGGVLYALYASVQLDAAGAQLLATGRIVTQDGDEVRAPVQVSVPATARLNEAAGRALKLLLEKLDVNALPATLPHLEEKPVAVSEKPAELPGPPPPPPIAVLPAPAPALVGQGTLRVLAWGTGAAAVALLGTSLGFGISAAVGRGDLPGDGRFTAVAQAQTQASVNQRASFSLVAGLGAGLFAGLSALLFIAPQPITLSLAPGPAGGSLVLSGRLF